MKLLVIIGILLTACGATNTETRCVTGSSVACACENGSPGVQTCSAGGTLSPCRRAGAICSAAGGVVDGGVRADGGSAVNGGGQLDPLAASWQSRLLGNYGGPKIRMRSDADVFIDMSYAGRPEAPVTNGSQRADRTVDIRVVFPDAETFTGVFSGGVLTWNNRTAWIQDRAWQAQVVGAYGGPRIARQPDGDLAVDMSYASRPNAPVWVGYAEDDGSIQMLVFFPDGLAHAGVYQAGGITWDNGSYWSKAP